MLPETSYSVPSRTVTWSVVQLGSPEGHAVKMAKSTEDWHIQGI